MPVCACGTWNDEGRDSCVKCGALNTGRRGQDINGWRVEDRRLVTAVFADLSGFTALGDKLDPEELHEIVAPLISRLAAAAENLGAYVAKYAGDALLLCFGAPVAQEDHGERALLAALRLHSELQEALPGLPPQARDLKLHIGVNSGWVIAGFYGGRIGEYSILGDAVNVAQRLESAAPPGETYVGDLTQSLTSARFDLVPVGQLTLKGKEQTVHAWRLAGQTVGRADIQPRALGGPAQLVGRERDLATVSRLAQDLVKGRGSVVLVTGEPGVGKSRLTVEVRRRTSGVRWLDGYCVSYGAGVPYWPYVDLLRRALGMQSDDVPEQARERLITALSETGVPEASPWFARLLGLPPTAGVDEPDVPPEQFRRALHAAFAGWLRAVARVAPAIILLEDLHWVDPSSMALTQDLFALTHDVRVGFLLTTRPDVSVPISAVVAEAQGVTSLSMTLTPLDDSAVRILVTQLLGDEAPSELVRGVVERTQGNPFFAEEIVRSLIDSGALHRNGHWRLETGWDVRTVPPTIEGVLAARIDLLPPAASRTLRIASVIGRVVPRPLLTAVASDGIDLDDAVSRLLETAFLDPLHLGGEEALAFHHPLALEVAYARSLRRQRRELHHRVANAAEELYGDGDHMIDFLAHHLYLADAEEKAVEYLVRAGDRAKRLFANDTAVLHFTRGLELLDRVSDGSVRADLELRLQVALAAPLIAVRGHGAPEVEQLCQRAMQLGEQVGRPADVFPVIFGLVGFHTARGDFRTASEHAHELMRIAQSAGDQGLELVASFACGITLFYRGQLLAARQHLDRGVALYCPEEHGVLALHFVFDPGVACLRGLGLDLWLLGHPQKALESSTRAVTVAKAATHPYGLAGATIFRAMLHQVRGKVDEVRTDADATLAVASEHGFPLWLSWARILRCWARVETEHRMAAGGENGHIRRLATELTAAVSAYEDTGSQIFLPYWLALAAQARRRSGETEEALSLLARALEVSEANDERWWEAELWRIRGELLLEGCPRQAPEAESCFQRALATATQQAARALEVRAAVSLARLWRTHHRAGDVKELLARVRASQHGVADTGDAAES